MPLDRVSRLRDCGVFHDFTWPVELQDFGRYNLVYGWNGSGKTTLSRVFQALERQAPLSMGQATLRIDGNEINSDSFPDVVLAVRVFNREFVLESVFPISGSDVPPIFVVGKESVERQKESDRLKARRTTTESLLETTRNTQHQAERIFDRFCQDGARAIKDALRSPDTTPYNNYDKSDFQSHATTMVVDDDAPSHRLSDIDRNSLLKQIRSSPKPHIHAVSYQLPASGQLAYATKELLSTTVISAAIQTLKDNPKLAAWIRDGLALHRERTTHSCLFCTQPLPQHRLAELEAHFSTEYERFLGRLSEQIEQLRGVSGEASALALPSTTELYDDLQQQYADAELVLRHAIQSVRTFLDEITGALTEKKTQPFDHVASNFAIPTVASNVVDRLNEIIRRHNDTSNEFEARVGAARDRLADDMIAVQLADFIRLREAVEQAGAAIQPPTQERRQLTMEIERLERDIVEHRRPADELNDELRQYLGHGELKLEVKDKGYSITRNGKPAQLLSEGEMTAIALLYFLKALDDRGFNLPKGIIVLDDPMSSLDQNALFAAFGYIRARTQTAGQVFVLTHNFMFFRLVREWFENLRGHDKKAWRVYMLECSHHGTHRTAAIRPIDPLLMDFESEYHYLFARIYRMATEPQAATLETYYFAPTIARRVIETFVAFRVPDLGGHNRLWSQMQTIKFDDARKSRIYRYMQTHAHRDVVGDSDEDLTLLGESRAVLNDVLDFMRTADPDHVARMITRVSTISGAADGAADA